MPGWSRVSTNGGPARLAAVVLAPALLLTAACSDDPQPRTSGPSAPTATAPSPTTSASPAEVPAAHRSLIRAWWSAYDEMLRTGDVAEYRGLGASLCQPCNDRALGVALIYEAGGSIRGVESTVLAIRRVESAAGSEPTWSRRYPVYDVTVETTGFSFQESAAAPLRTRAAAAERYQVGLRKGETSWFVADYSGGRSSTPW